MPAKMRVELAETRRFARKDLQARPTDLGGCTTRSAFISHKDDGLPANYVETRPQGSVRHEAERTEVRSMPRLFASKPAVGWLPDAKHLGTATSPLSFVLSGPAEGALESAVDCHAVVLDPELPIPHGLRYAGSLRPWITRQKSTTGFTPSSAASAKGPWLQLLVGNGWRRSSTCSSVPTRHRDCHARAKSKRGRQIGCTSLSPAESFAWQRTRQFTVMPLRARSRGEVTIRKRTTVKCRFNDEFTSS